MFKLLGNNPYFNALRNINSVLDKDQKRRSLIMIGLMLLSAFLDVFGLVTIIALVSSALEDEILTSSNFDELSFESSFESYFYSTLRSLYENSGADNVIEFLFISSIFIFFIFLIKNAFSVFVGYIQARYAYNISLRLNKKMFSYYFKKGYNYIQEFSSGKKVYTIVDIPMRFANAYLMPSLQFTSELMVLLILSVGLLCYDARAVFLVMLVVIPVFAIIYLFSKNRIKRLGFIRNEMMPKNYATVIESMKGFIDIALSNHENKSLNKYLESQKRLNEVDVKFLGIYNKLHQRTNDIIFGLGIMVIFGYAYFFDIQNKEVLTLLGVFGIAAYKFLPSVNRLMNTILTIKNSSFVIDELKSISKFNDFQFQETPKRKFHKSIELKNLSFYYSSDGDAVLQDFDLKIPLGQVIGIIGESGSGKTTLLKILLRVMTQSQGEFWVDGNELKSEKDNIGFRKNLGFVEQEVFILNGTLRENIAFGEDIVDEEALDDAIENSMLEKFVNSQKEGLDMVLGENGVKLSGGQKQRVGIARALYKKSEILLFDEATSALDPKTEKAIVESIDHLATLGKTIIIVAHRITTLENCDRIIELRNGKIHKEHAYQDLIKEIVM